MSSVSETPDKTRAACDSSYGHILKSSSVVGGAQALTQLFGLLRVKIAAVFLGPSGVGLVGLYVSLIGLVQSVAQVGLDQSGVREIAASASAGDNRGLAKTAQFLRRACWTSGIVGWVLTAIFAAPLTKWTFGSEERVWAVAVLGGIILLESLASAQKALLQGVRRLGDLAKLQVAGSLLSTLVAALLYWQLGEKGVVPVLLLTSAVQLACSWFFARRIKLVKVTQSWAQSLQASGQLIKLGAAFMYGGVLISAAGFLVRSFVSRDFGIDAAGMYQAAWALSGMYAAFILQALGADFYPKLSGVSSDNALVNRLVNEQIEVGLLLAWPGVVGVIAFASWIVHLFYSSAFDESARMLPWFALGVLGQVFSWPVGMIPAAKSATPYLYINRTVAAALHAGLAVGLLHAIGLQGAAIGFCMFVWIQNGMNTLIARRLSGFTYSASVMKLLALCVSCSLLAWLGEFGLPGPLDIVSGLLLCLISFGLSIRNLADRIPRLAALFGDGLCGLLRVKRG